MENSNSKTYTPDEIRTVAGRIKTVACRAFIGSETRTNGDIVEAMLMQGATAIERLARVKKEASAMLKVNAIIHFDDPDQRYTMKQVHNALSTVMQAADGELES